MKYIIKLQQITHLIQSYTKPFGGMRTELQCFQKAQAGYSHITCNGCWSYHARGASQGDSSLAYYRTEPVSTHLREHD